MTMKHSHQAFSYRCLPYSRLYRYLGLPMQPLGKLRLMQTHTEATSVTIGLMHSAIRLSECLGHAYSLTRRKANLSV
jgi:hypothetical protein